MDKGMKTKGFAGRRALVVLSTAIVAAGGISATALAQRGDDTPQTVCHKPGTAAEHQLTIDNDALVQAHLMHGDSLGPCGAATAGGPGDPGAPASAPAAAAVESAPRTTG